MRSAVQSLKLIHLLHGNGFPLLLWESGGVDLTEMLLLVSFAQPWPRVA